MTIGATPLEGEPQRQVGLNQGKYALLLQLLFLLLLLLSGRLFWLQIIQGEQNQARARENSVRVAPSQPIRGQVLDRHGEVLVSSHQVHKLYVWPKEATGPNWRRLRHRISVLLNVSEEELEKRRAGFRAGDYRIALTDVLTPAQTIKLLEQAGELPGAEVGVDYLRAYPHGITAAHVLGYTSPITDKELSHLAGQGYRIRDRIGRTGLEAAYEQHLRGQWGGRTLEVSANGDVQRPLGEKPSVPGRDLQLTLDLSLQQASEKAIANYPVGAIVAMDPRDGAILAMVSRPAYDPNFFLPAGQTPGGTGRLVSLQRPAHAEPGPESLQPGQCVQGGHGRCGDGIRGISTGHQAAHHRLHRLWRPLLPGSQWRGVWPHRL